MQNFFKKILQLIQNLNLTIKIIFFIVFIIVLPFTIILFLLIFNVHTATDKVEKTTLSKTSQQVEEDLKNNVRIKSDLYDYRLKSNMMDLDAIKNNIVDNEFNEKELSIFHFKHQLSNSVYFIDASNNIMMSPPMDSFKQKKVVLSSLPEFSFLKSADETRTLGRWIGPYDDFKSKTRIMSYVLPVWDNNVFKGVLGVDMTTNVLLQNVISIDPSKNTYIFLVRNSGEIISASDNIKRDLGLDVEKQSLNLFDSKVFRNQGIYDTTTFVDKTDGAFDIDKGKSGEKLIIYSTIPSFSGKLFVLSPLDEIIQIQNENVESAHRIISNVEEVGMINAIIFGIIIVLITFYLINLSILGPIRHLKGGIESIENDDFSTRVDIASKDEIGSLAASFNRMADKLQSYYSVLELKVKERTHDLEEKVMEIEKKNVDLGDTSRAMINILEDARGLEEQLKVEKEGVQHKVEERTKALSDAKDEVTKGWIQLQKEKARLSSSIEGLPIGFIMTDTDNNVVVSNTALEKILDFKDPKWTLSDITKGIAGKVDIVAECMKCIKEKAVFNLKDITFGSKYLHISISPIQANATEVIGTVILVEDVTEAIVLQRSRDEFFSIASHELRTPLTSIKGNTSMIEEYYGDKLQDKDLKEMIDDIHESSVRLINIVNDFLDMSRLEQGRIEFKKEVFDIVPLIEQIVYDIARMAKEKNIFVKFDQPSGLHPKVTADSARTKQIIFNLLGNALKFTTNGGVTVTIDTSEKLLNVHITDTGQGVPVTSQALLFRKFQQAENNILTRDGTKGTGLGLYISRLMANGMRGEVVLEKSVENKGSTFLLTLPLATEEDKKNIKEVEMKVVVPISEKINKEPVSDVSAPKAIEPNETADETKKAVSTAGAGEPKEKVEAITEANPVDKPTAEAVLEEKKLEATKDVESNSVKEEKNIADKPAQDSANS